MFDRLPASHYGMPHRVSRQWILDNANLGQRVWMRTPGAVEAPIPEDRRAIVFTHVTYIGNVRP